MHHYLSNPKSLTLLQMSCEMSMHCLAQSLASYLTFSNSFSKTVFITSFTRSGLKGLVASRRCLHYYLQRKEHLREFWMFFDLQEIPSLLQR
ncbi:hypothetical protein C0J52_15077 [Blattella germanica]|nr:hypothetical protein C0J52_15077 [Blattella germanica]